MNQNSRPIQAAPSRSLILLVIAIALVAYFYSQTMIGTIPALPCGIQDNLQIWTSGINAYLGTHTSVANALMILYSGFGDLAVVTLVIFMIVKKSIRPILPLFVFIILRQSMQLLVSLPLPSNLIWHYPGFPSLFSNYAIDNDFYFSAYVGINLLATLCRRELNIKWVTVLGFLILLFQLFVALVLRSHYTTDLYTSIITASFAFIFTQKLSTAIDQRFSKFPSYRYALIALTFLGAVFYFGIQHIVSSKPVPQCQITDVLLDFFLPINTYLFTHVFVGNTLLIVMNTILDALTLLIFGITIWKKDIRPFLILMIFFVLRQTLQTLVKLPLPHQIVWYYPGFPSLLQTYGITSDFFFSGHTGTSLLAALELSYFRKRWLTVLGFSLFLFEAIAVIAGHIHYTMDVFTAIITVFCFTDLSFKIAPKINRFLTLSK